MFLRLFGPLRMGPDFLAMCISLVYLDNIMKLNAARQYLFYVHTLGI